MVTKTLLHAFSFNPFFVVNGILTGTGLETQVVWYNSSEFMGYRALSIPLEDFFYGMLMIVLNVMIFEYLESKRQPSKINN